MDRRVAPSVQIEAAIEAALLDGRGEPDRLSELGRLGARLVLQRAVEDELAAFLGRARYERTETAAGSRNGPPTRRQRVGHGVRVDIAERSVHRSCRLQGSPLDHCRCLSIVRAIGVAHDGEIHARARPLGGLEVELTFRALEEDERMRRDETNLGRHRASEEQSVTSAAPVGRGSA